MLLNTLIATLLAASPLVGPETSLAGAAVGPSGLGAVGVYAGAFDGMGVRTDSGGAALLVAGITPGVKSGAWALDFPLRFHHVQTFGASLSETFGSAYASVGNRVAKGLRLGASLGLSGAWRPGWPDLYQPNQNLQLASTDRYSYFAWHAGLGLAAKPFARNHLSLRYQYVHYGYTRDPNFDPASPMHLTPRDNGQHSVEGAWRVVGDGYSVAARFGYVHRGDEVYLARDAITGSTNATGAPYTTPFQRLDRVEPSIQVVAKRLGGRLDVSLLYGYQIQSDRYQGYYSYAGHHPRLVVGYAFTESLSARVRGEAWLREYGSSSKAAGLVQDPNNPTPGLLENGTRLYDRRGLVAATVSYGLTKQLSAHVTGEWVRRSTNYPDYIPGYYPSTKLYSIEWSYVNKAVMAGIEYRL